MKVPTKLVELEVAYISRKEDDVAPSRIETTCATTCLWQWCCLHLTCEMETAIYLCNTHYEVVYHWINIWHLPLLSSKTLDYKSTKRIYMISMHRQLYKWEPYGAQLWSSESTMMLIDDGIGLALLRDDRRCGQQLWQQLINHDHGCHGAQAGWFLEQNIRIR